MQHFESLIEFSALKLEEPAESSSSCVIMPKLIATIADKALVIVDTKLSPSYPECAGYV